MPKIFWYYCVVAIGIAFMIVTMVKKRNFLDLFSFFLSATALGYLFEVLGLFVLGSYQYKPGVFKDFIAEDILGHLLCNGFFWGGIAVFISAFSLNSLWILLISIAFMFVEIFFLKVGAYEHHWWKLYMTGISAFVIFTTIKKWFLGLRKNKQHFIIGLVQNVYQDDILFSVPYQLCLAIIYSVFVTAHKKWYYTFLPLVLNILIDSLFAFLKILNFYNGCNLFYFEFFRILGFVIFILLEKYTLWSKGSYLIKGAKS